MIKLDFHSPTNTDMLGYGAAFHAIRGSLSRRDDIVLADNYSGGDLQIYFGSPWDALQPHFERKSDIFMIFTMFEFNIIPREWFPNLNRADALIVPCQWNADIFRQNGWEKPIYVVPLGIDPARWPYLNRPRQPDDPFNIIWQGTHGPNEVRAEGDRKGSDIVIRVFDRLKLKNARLTLKMNPKYLEHGTTWNMPYRMDGSIWSIGQLLSYEDILKLLTRMDISIYPSQGEGFGLIPLEHMATGLPVIVADNTGMSQFCRLGYNMPIRSELKSAFYDTCGVGYQPNEDEVAEMLLWAYENRPEIARMGQSASEWVHSSWTSDHSASALINVVKGAMQNVA